MKIVYFSVVLLFIPFIVMAQQSRRQEDNYVWVKSAGGSDMDWATCISLDDDNNCYITGLFKGTVNFGNIELRSIGGDDIFIAKYNESAEVLWAKKCGGEHADYGFGIASDNLGNSYITGQFWGEAQFGSTTLKSNGGLDIFIAKYDSIGNILWVRKAGGVLYDRSFGIAVDSKGSPIITGFFTATAHFGSTELISAGPQDMFIAKFDPLGNLLWVRQAGGSSYDSGSGIEVDRYDNCFVTGYFRSSAVFETTELVSAGGIDIFIAKYDAHGRVQWVRRAGGKTADTGNAIAVDRLGNCFVVGTFEGTADFDSMTLHSAGMTDIFIAKYNVLGNLQWIKSAGGAYEDVGYDVDVNGLGGCVITGSFEFDTQFDATVLSSLNLSDIFIANYDRSGNVLWAKSAGGISVDVGRSIATDKLGRCYVTGYFDHSAIFDTTTIVSKDGYDIFMAKLGDQFEPITLPNAFNLYQNFPNPFNLASVISFHLPESAWVQLVVYNIIGQKVETLIDQQMEYGYHYFFWNTQELTSGIYFYKIEAGKYTAVRKCLLLK